MNGIARCNAKLSKMLPWHLHPNVGEKETGKKVKLHSLRPAS
jgi:hypothetical protein